MVVDVVVCTEFDSFRRRRIVDRLIYFPPMEPIPALLSSPTIRSGLEAIAFAAGLVVYSKARYIAYPCSRA